MKLFQLGVLALVSSAFAAPPATFGDWSVGVADNRKSFYASSINDSGAVFGEWCYVESGKCLWLIGMSASCEEGESYPVLANSDHGAAHLSVKCQGKVESSQLFAYVFADYESLEEALQSSDRIGFAVPMEADQFRVVRFSLVGAVKATASAEALTNRAVQSSHGTRDTTL